MKLISAVIKPFQLDDVRRAISGAGVQGLTVTEIRGDDALPEFVPKTKIEIAVVNSLVDSVLDAIARAAQTGKAGNERIMVLDLTQVVRIRTGERDDCAI